MFRRKRKWEDIPYDAFVDEIGEGKQLGLIITRYVHIFQQKFLAGTRVDYHSHDVWEIVIRFGWGIMFAIYPPGTEHCLFGPSRPKGKWWSIVSIKIGKSS